MNWFSMLALCASANAPTTVNCDSVYSTYQKELTQLEISPREIDAITRTAYAEAANQGVAGLSGVVFTILNRKISGQFSHSIEEIINRVNQFEPVTKAEGWENLPSPSSQQRARIETIIELAQSGHLTDPTGGALYFQNAKIVAERVQKSAVSSHLEHFGHASILATINDHTFYAIMCQPQQASAKINNALTPLRLLNSATTSNGIKQLRGNSPAN
jgi:spore germination cell wall hydrolase CwlJ-like protein